MEYALLVESLEPDICTTNNIQHSKAKSYIYPIPCLDSQPQLIIASKSDRETLQTIDRQFIQLVDRHHVYFSYEGKPTVISGAPSYIVEEESAAPVIQNVERACTQQGHAHMCKVEDENTPGSSLVAEGIQR